jgi:hypothetical protein
VISLLPKTKALIDEAFRKISLILFILPWLMGEGKTEYFIDYCISHPNFKIIIFTATNGFGDEVYNRLIEKGYPKNRIYHAVGKYYKEERDGNILLQGFLCRQEDQITECKDCEIYKNKGKCPNIKQKAIIKKTSLVIAPVNMSYLGKKYHWDVGFFDENFFDVLMKSWYKSEEKWKDLGIEWKDFPKQTLRDCTKDCIFYKTDKCRSWENSNGVCKNIGYQKTMTPIFTRKPQNIEELHTYNDLGWNNHNNPRISGVWDEYKENTCIISFSYLSVMKIDEIYFASATCSEETIKHILFGKKKRERVVEVKINLNGKKKYENQVFCITEIPKNNREKKPKQLTGTKKKAKELLKNGRLWKLLNIVNDYVDELDIPFNEKTFAFGYQDVVSKISVRKYPLKKANFTRAIATNKFRECSHVLGLNKFQFPFGYKYLIAQLFNDPKVVDDLENEKRIQPMGRGRNSIIILLFSFKHHQFPNVIIIDLSYLCRKYIQAELKKIMAVEKSFCRKSVSVKNLYGKCSHEIRIGRQEFNKIANEEISKLIISDPK